jgi:hypothetical protein
MVAVSTLLTRGMGYPLMRFSHSSPSAIGAQIVPLPSNNLSDMSFFISLILKLVVTVGIESRTFSVLEKYAEAVSELYVET